MARKPLIGTVAANVLEWGTGGLNIDGCRVGTAENLNGGAYSNGSKDLGAATSYATGANAGEFVQPTGRWPANIIHGTHDTRKIGRKSSDGCIGLFNENIAELFELCPVGTQVRVI